MIKRKRDLKALLDNIGNPFKVIYLPPDSPLINPLGGLFRKINQQLMTAKECANTKELFIYLNEEMKKKNEELIKQHFE